MSSESLRQFARSPQGHQVVTLLRDDDITHATLLQRVHASVVPALHAVVTKAEYGFQPEWQFKTEMFFEPSDWHAWPVRVHISIGLALSFLIEMGNVPLELHPKRAQTGTKVYRACPPLDGDWSGFYTPELSS
ncbi:hypothetical protein HNQ51_000139 [Inhella inkyongensis]|uniref:Uncharacterized protein n=1 Tax=Inhella inkyongensis TaxID=392593 RepID=A0A840S190_9BURK|nr:hypothetical protein [Inhella inkyongensis]MBB5202846.1 hypothetical protein [Inhella inkyongensis]